MIRVIYSKRVQKAKTGEWWLAHMVSADALSKSVITGADVDGMSADDKISAGSIIYTPSAVYIAFSDETFQESEKPEEAIKALTGGLK